MTSRIAAVVAALLGTTGACLVAQPGYDEFVFVCRDGERCPAGYVCDQGYCTARASGDGSEGEGEGGGPSEGEGEGSPDAVEQCNGVDDDRDGKTDEEDDDYVARSCPLQAGVCYGATARCGGEAGPLLCSAADYGESYSEDEICGDGLDNDCDGETDPRTFCECLDGQEQPCRHWIYGECGELTGIRTCVRGSWGACEGAVQPTPEVCDGKDNDCDNDTDEPADEVCGPCPWNAVHIGDYCVDRFEASFNPELASAAASLPGASPWTNVDFASARQACANAGKNLCGKEVWTQACGGAAGSAYPYGPDHQDGACNGSGGVVEDTGNRPVCASQWTPRRDVPDSGLIYDMSGNVEEWVSPSAGRPADRIAMGGSYLSADGAALHCTAELNLGASDGAPHRGFRCCKDIR